MTSIPDPMNWIQWIFPSAVVVSCFGIHPDPQLPCTVLVFLCHVFHHFCHHVDTSDEFCLCCCGDEGGELVPLVSFSFFIRNHVLVPSALAKWSSTV